MKCSWSLPIVLAGCLAGFVPEALAQSSDVPSRFSTIHAETASALRNATSREARDAAMNERRRRLGELLDGARATPGAHDGLLAAIAVELERYDVARTLARRGIQRSAQDEVAWCALVQALARLNEAQEASTTFAEALRRFPESAPVQTLRIELVETWVRAREPGRAADELREVLRDGWPSIVAHPEQARTFLQEVDRLIGYDRAARQYSAALKTVSDLLNNARSAVSSGREELRELADELLDRRLRLLADAGQRDEALSEVNDFLDRVGNRITDTRPNLHFVRRKLALLQTKLDILALTGEPVRAQATRRELLVFADEQLERYSQVPEIVEGWLTARQQTIAEWVREQQLEQAQEGLAAVRRLIEQREQARPEMTPIYERGRAALDHVERRLNQERHRVALLGQPAPAWPAGVRWVDDREPTPNQRQGQVVLLVFLAAWSDPCRAILPELKEWHARYAPRGLVVLGATHAGASDAEPGESSSRREPKSDGDTLVALSEFARRHEIPFPVAHLPGPEFFQAWRVGGVPQLAVIDRRGVVTLIRVGSGRPNLHAIEAAFERALASPPDTVSPKDKP